MQPPAAAEQTRGIAGERTGQRGSLTFDVENDKDYLLLVFAADNWIAGNPIATFGDYRLQIGVNAPRAIEDDVQATGAVIAQPIYDLHRAVQEYRGTFPADDKVRIFSSNTFSLDMKD